VKRTSYPRQVSRSVRVAGAAVVVTAAVIYFAVEQGRALRASRALRELPATARLVLSINPDALAQSASARTLLRTFIDEDQLTDIEATCGLDPWSDLSELTVWIRGSDREPFDSFGVALTGRSIDAVSIAQCHGLLVDARGGSVVRLEGPTGPLLASDDRQSAIALVNGRTVVTGSVRTVAEAMAVRQGRLPALEHRTKIAEVWPDVRHGAALALVLEPPPYWKTALERIAAFGDDPAALDGIKTIAVSAKRGAETTVEVLIDTESPELAHRNARLIMGWAKSPPEDMEPPWTDILRTTRVHVARARVIATLDLSALGAAR
jgi:hypothetical protein